MQLKTIAKKTQPSPRLLGIEMFSLKPAHAKADDTVISALCSGAGEFVLYIDSQLNLGEADASGQPCFDWGVRNCDGAG